MRDTVRYAVGFGVLGEVARRAVVARDVRGDLRVPRGAGAGAGAQLDRLAESVAARLTAPRGEQLGGRGVSPRSHVGSWP